jgi:hypothetical protein
MGALEDFNTDGALFQGLSMPVELVLDDVPEELFATPCISEETAFQDVLKLMENLLLFLVFQGNRAGRRTLIAC